MADSSDTTFGYWGVTSEEILSTNFPLHRACRDGDAESLSMLLVEAQHGIYVEDSFYGWTPAHWSAYFGKLNCLMKLLEQGMNCDTATMRLNQTPAHIAAFACNSHCLKWLLHYGASKDRQLACLRKLMSVTRVGADCNIRTSRFTQTPAHLAAFGDHPQCLQWLLMSGAETDAQDYLGETPAHKGARTGSMECLSLLASHGARLYIRNNNNLTPAQLSAECGFMDCSRYLESAASSQEQSDCLGVYEDQKRLESNTTASASPHDITANRVEPCVANFGKLPPPPPPSEASNNGFPSSDIPNEHCINELNGVEFDMEEDYVDEGCSGNSPHINAFQPNRHSITYGTQQLNKSTSNPNGDITLDTAVSHNQIAVGGRKRCREDGDENDFKRMRKSDTDYSPAIDAALQESSSQTHYENISLVEFQNQNDAHESIEIEMEGKSQEAYQAILSLSTEPLKLDKPVVPYSLQHNTGCPYYIFM